MASTVAWFTTLRTQATTSYVESPPSAGTTDIERCVTSFPVGFGGWTAAKMYETSINDSNPRHIASENVDNSTARQQVGSLFLPREAAMLARIGDCNSVCLSVCRSVRLSVTRVLCEETKEHTANILNSTKDFQFSETNRDW